jgi:hypothetical protein
MGSIGAPPALFNMYITSVDTLEGREIDQNTPPEWNDQPPLFKLPRPEVRRWRLRPPPPEEEDPTLLKGVRKFIGDRPDFHFVRLTRSQNSRIDINLRRLYRCFARESPHL